jgi:methionyl-tRNA formyltransferase
MQQDMSNIIPPERSPRVIFLGMQGNFSLPSLRALLKQNIEVCAVVVPAPQVPGRESLAMRQRERPRLIRSVLPLLDASIVELAWEHNLPVWEVQHLSDAGTISTLAAYEPDTICVACFSQRIPPAILQLPRFGCLNVHPSLLPANRGPVPLFWTFHEGDEQAGITIHLMDEGIDSGDILAQEPIHVPDGISYTQLEARCAVRGGELLARTVWNLYRGLARCVPQEETKSSYHPFPAADDFVVHASEWSARHVYNFICGVAHWNGPVNIDVGGERFQVREAISYSHLDTANTENTPAETEQTSWVQCKKGWVRVVTTP